MIRDPHVRTHLGFTDGAPCDIGCTICALAYEQREFARTVAAEAHRPAPKFRASPSRGDRHGKPRRRSYVHVEYITGDQTVTREQYLRDHGDAP